MYFRKQVFVSIAGFLMLTSLKISSGMAQDLKPGFDKDEFIELIKIHSRQVDTPSAMNAGIGDPHSKLVYRSAVVGLDNRWDLWMRDGSVAIISIRGTTIKTESWLGNFYAAMIPAKGTMNVSAKLVFNYQLADNPRAAVHVGWLLATACIADDIVRQVDSCYKTGIRNYIISGHSQGGAIAFLMTSHLRQLQKQGILPADMIFKTYCSAAPKPGNLYYAYDYEASTANGWAFNVVNSADWVPETPMSIQTLNDFNKTNPFVNAPALIKKMKFPNNLVLKHAFNQLDKPTRKAQRKYQKYLGAMAAGSVKKYLTEYVPPVYYGSNDYVRTGSTIVLLADEDYYQIYPDSKERVFTHHMFQPYLYLTEKLKY